MAKKQQLKEEKAQKRREKQDSQSFSMVFVALAVAAAAMVIGMPMLLKKRPAGDLKLSFAAPPDARPQSCPKEVKVKTGKGAVSIIIPYLNEEWFRIQATMESIVKFTDMNLVREVMWISDGNSRDKVFASEIEAFHSKVTVHENEHNLGLITTKMQAAKRAGGSILVFLEPHIVVNAGWLPPLLNRLEEEPKALVMPSLDALTEDLKYHKAGVGHWRFEWNMNLVYTNPANVDGRDHQPYMSPATSGGIYAIRKDWWDKLEFFDPELIRWGGDHVEASHKVWRCGGRIEVHPCSRVGHWFRFESNRPYDVKVESVVRNYKRLAEVWFDDYKHLFYKMKPDATQMEIGNVTDMIERRQSLDCKDMSWYLRNVDVELAWEADKICIPGYDSKHGGCGKGTVAAPGLSTIDHALPLADYHRLAAKAEAFSPSTAGPCCKAIGRGCKRVCGKGESPSS